MADQIVVTELIIDARGAAKGSAEYVAGMAAVEAAAKRGQATYDRTIEKVRALSGAMQDGAMVMTGAGSSISKAARDYDKLIASMDPVAGALNKARAEFDKLKSIAAGGLSIGKPIEQVNALIDQATVKYGRLATAARASADAQVQAARAASQAQINSRLGVTSGASGSARSSADAFMQSGGGLDAVAAAQAKHIADSFTIELNSRLLAGTARAARDSASIFAAEMDRLDTIAQQKGAQAGAEFARSLDDRLITGVSKAARDSASVFSAEMDRLDTIAAQKGAQVGQEFTRALNARLVAGPGKSASGSASVFQEMFAEQTKAAEQFQRVFNETQPNAANDIRRNERLKQYADYLKTGRFNQEEFNNAVAYANRQFDLTKRAIDGTAVAVNGYAGGTKLARHELINLGRQGQDVFVSLASGQSPLMVLIQQGTQIADVFATSQGSVRGFFSQLLAGLAPLMPVIIAVTAGVTAFVAAWSALGQRQELANSLQGVGRAAGMTGDELNKLAKESADAGKVSISSAREMAAEFTRTGKIGGDVMRGLIKVSKDYATTTGQDLTPAVKELAEAFADPAKGMDALNSKLGFLDASTQQNVRRALEMNDSLRAQKILLDALPASINRADEATGVWAKTWENLKRASSNALDGLGERMAEAVNPSVSGELSKINGQLAANAAHIKQLREGGNARSDGYIERLQRENDLLDKRRKQLEGTAALDKQRAEIDQRFAKRVDDGLKASAIADTLDADRLKVAMLKQQAERLQAGINTSQGDTGSMGQALEKVKNQINDYAKATDGLTLAQTKAQQIDQIRKETIKDETPMQKAATAARIAAVEAMGTETTRTQRLEEARAAARRTQLGVIEVQEGQTRQSRDSVRASQAEESAVRASGSAYGEMGRLRAQAERERPGDPAGQALRVEELRQEALARVNKEQTDLNAKMREASSIQRSVNATGKAAGQSEAQMAEALQKRTALEAVKRDLMARGETDQNKINKATKEATAAIDEQNSALAQQRAIGMIAGQNEQIRELEKEIDLIGKSNTERRLIMATMQAEQDLRRANISAVSAEGKEYLKNAEKIAVLRNAQTEQLRLQQQLRQSMDFAADGLKSFVEELLTGTEGINGALKSLGKGFLSASLDALISGKGPLAGITGLASTDSSKQGGLMGLFSGGNIQALSKQLGKEVKEGAEKGTSTGITSTITSGDATSWLGINGKDLAGGLTAIAGLAGAYGSGMAASSYGQAVGGGALSGGMAGLALGGTSIGASLGGASVLGPIGLIIGGALAYFGQKSARDAAKKQREAEAQENYRQAEPGIATLRSQLRGESQDTLENRIKATLTEVQKGIDVAFFAKKIDEANALAGDFFTYRDKAIVDFQRAFGGIVESMMSGLGPNSAFAQARENIKQTGEVLKGFVSDAAYAFGAGTPQVEQAREAARTHALSILDGAKSLSVVATRMEEIRGAGVSLQTLLVELGMSATSAAEAIQNDTIAAMNRLRDNFRQELVAQVNDAEGVGYIDEVQALFKDIASRRDNAGLLGTLQSDGPLIDRLLKGRAQEIVDSAQLTGEAFQNLIRIFPDLNGLIHEFTEQLDAAAKAADIAARKLAYQDRLFAATNDATTLAGQMAAYDRTAMREIEAERKAGGEALLDLEMAQAAERFNIIRDWLQKTTEEQKRSLTEAQNYLAGVTRRIKEYLDGLRAGSDSPLSPQARLAAAQSQYNTQLGLAQGGNRDALNGITGYASDLLEAGKAYYASSQGFQTIFQQIQTQLGALPNQVSAEQFIVDAINASRDATLAKLAAIDVDGDGMITRAEAANTWLSKIFTELDVNGDNVISKFEQAIHADGLNKTAIVNAVNGGPGSTATLLSQYFNEIDSSVDGLIDKTEMVAALKGMASDNDLKALFQTLDTDKNGYLTKIETAAAATAGKVEDLDAAGTALAWIRAYAQTTDSYIAQQQALLDAMKTNTGKTATNVDDLDANGSALAAIQSFTNAGRIASEAINGQTAVQVATLQALNGQFSNQSAVSIQGNNLNNNMREALNKIVYNTAAANARTMQGGNSLAVPLTYAEGGLITGAGTGTSDSIPIMASNQEFMIKAASARSIGTPMLDFINDNGRIPAIAMQAGGAGNGDVVRELRAFREEARQARAENSAGLKTVARASIEGAGHIREGVDNVDRSARATAKKQSRQRFAA